MTHIDPEPESSPPSRAIRYSVAACPVCGGGLCTVRVFLAQDGSLDHGLVVCDECEAIWLQPDVAVRHVYVDPENPVSPISGQPLYDQHSSRWADGDDIETLQWTTAIDPSLTYDADHCNTDIENADV